MKITERRKALIARHAQEVERAVDAHKARMASMMERQRLELVELMLEESPQAFALDVIEILKRPLYQTMEAEPGLVDAEDARWMVRRLDELAEKITGDKEGAGT